MPVAALSSDDFVFLGLACYITDIRYKKVALSL